MDFIYQSPFNAILAAVLFAAAIASFIRGARLLSKGLRNPEHPRQTFWVIRGIRGGIIALACISIALGALFGRGGPILFGLLFLGEELFETGIMLLALRSGERADAKADAASSRGRTDAAPPPASS